MIESIIFGGGLALAAAIQPGPLQVFLFSSVAQRGWKRTLPAALAPIISDGPIAIIALLILNRLPEMLNALLQVGGGGLLLYLAWSSYRQWRKGIQAIEKAQGSIPRTIFQAALVNLLNPNPYLAWSLVLGPAAINAWNIAPIHAVGLLTAFYATLIFGLTITVILFGATSLLGDKPRMALLLFSVIILALLGIYLLITAVSRIASLS